MIGWSGADWRVANPLIDQGVMPQLANIVNNGVIGSLTGFAPQVAPMLWKTIVTGKHPHQHNVSGATKEDTCKCGSIWQLAASQSLPAQAIAWPFPQGDVFPKGRDDLADLRLRPEDVDQRLIGLFIQDTDKLDEQRHGKILQTLMIRLAELYSCHNRALHTLASEPPGLFCVHYRFIEQITHDFMQPSVINAQDSELFKDVIQGAYRLQDVLLADLLKPTEPQCSVFIVSAHGRPDPVATRRNSGIFAAAGRGIKRDEFVHGTAVADITPTLLHHMGLPIGKDMDGRVLTEIFCGSDEPKFIPSWEPLIELCEPAEKESGSTAPSPSRFHHDWNIGNAMFSLGRSLEALPYLEEAFFLRPDSITHAYPLVRCQLDLGLLDEAELTLDYFRDLDDESTECKLIQSEIAYQRGDLQLARTHLEVVKEHIAKATPILRDLYEWLLLRVGHHHEAAQLFSEALAIDPDNPTAWLGLAHAGLASGKTAEAKECALKAVGLQHDLPSGHLILGKCHEREKNFASAATSYELARALQPERPGGEEAIRRCRQKLEKPGGLDLYTYTPPWPFPPSGMTKQQKGLQNEAKQRRQQREQQRSERRKILLPSGPLVKCRLKIEGQLMVIREPWPDELDQIYKRCSNVHAQKASQFLVAVLTDAPERIVAMGTLCQAESTRNELDVYVYPRYQKTDLPGELLARLGNLSLNKTSVEVLLSDKNDWLEPLLEQAGYTMAQETELWHGVIQNMTNRLAPVIRQIDKRLAKREIDLELIPLKAADPEAIASIASENNLLSRHRIYNDLGSGSRKLKHDEDVSCLALVNGEAAGISLISRHDKNTALFDARAVVKTQKELSSIINAKMLFFFCQATAEKGIGHVLFFSNNSTWRETRRLAIRCHCQRVGWKKQMIKVSD